MANDSPRNLKADSLEGRLREAAQQSGEADVADRARSLLEGGYEGEEFLTVVGGKHAEGILNGAPALYWPELWGARALLYVWDDAVVPAVIAGLGNRAWRVREMCAKVCAQREVGDAVLLAELTRDDHARVRAAAARALAVVGDQSNAEPLEALLRDFDKEVRRTAQHSLKTLKERSA
jgi:hypothetical protein